MKIRQKLKQAIGWLESINPKNTERVTPDAGSVENVEQKGVLDKSIGAVSNIDQTIANIGSVGFALSKTNLPKIASTGRVATGIASKFEPVQAALWGIDATRAVADPEYRQRHLDALRNLNGSDAKILGKTIPADLVVGAKTAAMTLEHPIATSGALIRHWKEIQEKQKKLDIEGKQLEASLPELIQRAQYKKDVPFVSPSSIQSALRIQAAQKAFNR